MNLKTLSMMGALLLLAGTGVNAQKKKEELMVSILSLVIRKGILRLVSLIRIQVRLLRIMPI